MHIMKLPKPSWKLSDEEYVERTRVALRRTRPWLKMASFLWVIIVCAALLVSLQILSLALDHPDGPRTSEARFAYLMGALAGGTVGFILVKAVVLVSEAWFMERVYRIMLSSWDRVKELERKTDPQSAQVRPPPAGSPSP